jgi:hypothetical protein
MRLILEHKQRQVFLYYTPPASERFHSLVFVMRLLFQVHPPKQRASWLSGVPGNKTCGTKQNTFRSSLRNIDHLWRFLQSQRFVLYIKRLLLNNSMCGSFLSFCQKRNAPANSHQWRICALVMEVTGFSKTSAHQYCHLCVKWSKF